MEQENEENDKLNENIDKMNAILEQTEMDLSKANVEGQIVENILKTLRRSLEKQMQKKVNLEEKTLELLQDQITTDQASHYRGKVLREIQEKRRQMELTMYATEQQCSEVLFDLERWKANVARDKNTVEKLSVI